MVGATSLQVLFDVFVHHVHCCSDVLRTQRDGAFHDRSEVVEITQLHARQRPRLGFYISWDSQVHQQQGSVIPQRNYAGKSLGGQDRFR